MATLSTEIKHKHKPAKDYLTIHGRYIGTVYVRDLFIIYTRGVSYISYKIRDPNIIIGEFLSSDIFLFNF